MEFKFRAIDNRPPFSTTWASTTDSTPDPITIHDPILNPTNARDARQRQTEKDRIREEILAAERRRVLEIEVRRELQSEREIAKRRATEKFGFDDRVDPTVPPHLGFGGGSRSSAYSPVNYELTTAARSSEVNNDKLIVLAKPNSNLSGEKLKTLPAKGLSEVPVSSSKKINWEEAHSFRFSSSCIASSPIPVAPMWLSEPVPVNKYLTLPARPSELNMDKLIVLAKPSPNLSGMKRKTPPTKGPSDVPVSSSKKIHKEEWSCALCQVTVSNEKTFDGHLNGKRHKASEKRLVARGTRPTKGPSDVPVSSSKKIHKEEWSCALCQVTVSNEKTFDGHLNGKRHKASEKRLQAETLSKSFNLKNTAKKFELEKLESNGTAISELGEKKERGLLELNGVRDRDTSKEKPSKEKKEELPMQNDQCRDDSKNNVEVKPMLVLQRNEEATKAKKFEFLCDFCKVGSSNPKVMEKHRRGKKHRDQLRELTEKYTDRVKELEKNKVRTTDVIEEANVHTPASSMAPEATHEANMSIRTTVPVASLVATDENASLLDSINETKEANICIPTAVVETSTGANEARASVSTTDVTEEANANVPTTTSVAMASSSEASDAAEIVRKLEAYEKMIKARLCR